LENILADAKKTLREAGISSWALDGNILMAYVLKISREQLIIRNKHILSQEEKDMFECLVEKRRNFMPVGYITNNVEFMGLDFYVNDSVLIPRPDTEALVEAAISYINKNGTKAVLDMCTGSGAIAVSIAHYCPWSRVTAIDISPKAIDVAVINRDKNKVSINYMQSNMFENVCGVFDLIVSNPPYISKSEMKGLPENVANYEPHLALYGGEDGLLFYRILAGAGEYLHDLGKMFIEIGAVQKKDVIDIFIKENFYLHSALKDLAGLDRVLIFGKNV